MICLSHDLQNFVCFPHPNHYSRCTGRETLGFIESKGGLQTHVQSVLRMLIS